MQMWKKPDFQYSKLSIRLSAFGSTYSKISNGSESSLYSNDSASENSIGRTISSVELSLSSQSSR
ncbi:MAG TPA: hypothetical protein VKA98_07685 [Nitrososphaeraceae archaeon]|nr:hypothetical protein [Nitrososphaeraceae archaeon]